MRTFRDLMLNAGVASCISPGWAVVLVLTSSILQNASVQATGGYFDYGEVSLGAAIASTVLWGISIAILAKLLLHVQANLNRYWESLENVTLVDAKIGMSEAIYAILGFFLWFDSLANIFSSAYRGGF